MLIVFRLDKRNFVDCVWYVTGFICCLFMLGSLVGKALDLLSMVGQSAVMFCGWE